MIRLRTKKVRVSRIWVKLGRRHINCPISQNTNPERLYKRGLVSRANLSRHYKARLCGVVLR